MKAQKVQFIFVEKDPWYKKVANGFSGKAAAGAKYGCNTHGFKTDSSKYRFSNSFMKDAKRSSKSSASQNYDTVAFSADEPTYPDRRTASVNAYAGAQPNANRRPDANRRPAAEKERTMTSGNTQNANAANANTPKNGEPIIHKRGEAWADMRPARSMHEDRRMSAAIAPQNEPHQKEVHRKEAHQGAHSRKKEKRGAAASPARPNATHTQAETRHRQLRGKASTMQETLNQETFGQEQKQSLGLKQDHKYKQQHHHHHPAKVEKSKPSEAEIADKLSKAFDDYDASEQSFGMSAAMYQEDLRKKAQEIKEKSADKFSAARDRFAEASLQEDTFASKLRVTYERIAEQINESKNQLILWGAGGAAGFVVCFVISMIIVNANY